MDQVTIGITDCGRYESYADWIKNTQGVEVIKLSYHDDNISALDQCDGMLLTGGHDVHPGYYNKLEYMDYYKDSIPDIDEKRDAFEWKLLEYSQEKKLPVLGICRGLQITNVFFGGTLVADIPAMGKRSHSKIKEGEDRYHTINVTSNSVLEKISGTKAGVVNSAHHQSALTVAGSLSINAVSDDGIIEGLERKEFYEHPYLVLVQWHPERMNDQQDAFSFNIRSSFLDAVKKFRVQDSI